MPPFPAAFLTSRITSPRSIPRLPTVGLNANYLQLPDKRLFWISLRVPWENVYLFLNWLKTLHSPSPEVSSDFTVLTTVLLKSPQIIVDKLYYKYIVLQL